MKESKPVMSFGSEEAETYRDVKRGDEAAAVAFLEPLASGGRALELGIGAGRIALPLAARGIEVEGIDISPDMLDQLRSKPRGERIAVTVGDFADVSVEGKYKLIYVVWNTFFNLLSQDDQVRCFKNVASHLSVDGAFVIEAYVPAFLYRLRNDQYVDAESVLVDQVRLDVLRHDMAHQMIEESHVTLSAEGIRLNPVVQRYAWPSELDLMAQMSGLCLKDRWAGWKREPYESKSELHVSVYGLEAET
jgi:SAM-dependent methyltransferase